MEQDIREPKLIRSCIKVPLSISEDKMSLLHSQRQSRKAMGFFQGLFLTLFLLVNQRVGWQLSIGLTISKKKDQKQQNSGLSLIQESLQMCLTRTAVKMNTEHGQITSLKSQMNKLAHLFSNVTKIIKTNFGNACLRSTFIHILKLLSSHLNLSTILGVFITLLD